MEAGILLTIALKGRLEGFKKHSDKQIVSVDVTPIGSKNTEIVHKKIRHSDRNSTECTRKLRISEEIVSYWKRSECPFWEKPSDWKNKTPEQKLQSYVKRYDEGYGVSYEYIG